MTHDGEIPVAAFRFLDADDYGVLMPVVTRVVVPKQEVLFRTGDGAEGVYFLEKGRLAVLKETGFNQRTQVVALLEPGAPVGEGGALGGFTRSATIMAIEESLLFCLGRGALDTLAEKAPHLLVRILKRLLYTTSLRLQKSSERLAHIL